MMISFLVIEFRFQIYTMITAIFRYPASRKTFKVLSVNLTFAKNLTVICLPHTILERLSITNLNFWSIWIFSFLCQFWHFMFFPKKMFHLQFQLFLYGCSWYSFIIYNFCCLYSYSFHFIFHAFSYFFLN